MKNETRIKRVALYRHYDEHSILLYVGISLSAIHRLSQHQKSSTWISSAVRMETVWFDTKAEALAAEKKAIQTENPIHNIKYNKPLRTNIYLPVWLNEAVKKAADAQRINTSEYIRDVLKAELRQNKQSQANQNLPAN